jgi:Fic family protein
MWKHGMQNIIEEMLPTLERLAEKKALLDAQRPLPDFIVQKIKEGLNVEWTYNSNSIEGNTLTLNETKVILEEGMTIGGKSLREHFEITNHHEAIEYLEGLVKPKYVLTERDVLDIHELVMSKIGKDFAGRIRNVPVRITGANFIPPSVAKVPEMLAELIEFVNENPLKLNDVLLASLFHHRFVWIHPFIDGNGRTVRLVMNLILMRKGYPPAIILRTDRKKYYDALNQANNGSYQKISLLMAQATERSLDIYLNSLPNTYKEIKSISSIVEEDEVPYGQEYISLLARQGKIAAYKEGRNWVTTEDAIAEYRKSRKRNRK